MQQLAVDFAHDVFHAVPWFEVEPAGPERLDEHLEAEPEPRGSDMDARSGIGGHFLEIPGEPANSRMHGHLGGHARHRRRHLLRRGGWDSQPLLTQNAGNAQVEIGELHHLEASRGFLQQNHAGVTHFHGKPDEQVGVGTGNQDFRFPLHHFHRHRRRLLEKEQGMANHGYQQLAGIEIIPGVVVGVPLAFDSRTDGLVLRSNTLRFGAAEQAAERHPPPFRPGAPDRSFLL